MTKQQEKAVETIRSLIVRHRSAGQPDKHEFKEFTVKDFGSFISLVAEYGYKGDETNIGLRLFARDRRAFHIFKGGRVELSSLDANLKLSTPKNVRGAFESVIYWHKD